MARPDFAVRVDGIRELRKTLRVLDKDLLKEVQKVSKQGAEIVAKEARSHVPQRSGRLKKAIKAGTSGDKGVVRARPVNPNDQGKPWSDTSYANVVQWGGTVGRGHRRGHAGSTSISPSHFMTNALEAKGPEVKRHLSAGIDDVIRRHGL